MPTLDYRPVFDSSEIHRVGGRGAIVGQPKSMAKSDTDLVAAFLAKNQITRPTAKDETLARKARAKLELSYVVARSDAAAHDRHAKRV
jgi:hypothetical protein